MYVRSGSRYRLAKGVEVMEAAAFFAAQRIEQERPSAEQPDLAKRFLIAQLSHCEEEFFAVLFLDTHNHVIAFEKMFRGTVDGASVYPREVVRAVLDRNAANVIIAHNHPSGFIDPSDKDMALTRALTRALELIEVRVLDHIIVGGLKAFSFSENGLL